MGGGVGAWLGGRSRRGRPKPFRPPDLLISFPAPAAGDEAVSANVSRAAPLAGARVAQRPQLPAPELRPLARGSRVRDGGRRFLARESRFLTGQPSFLARESCFLAEEPGLLARQPRALAEGPRLPAREARPPDREPRLPAREPPPPAAEPFLHARSSRRLARESRFLARGPPLPAAGTFRLGRRATGGDMMAVAMPRWPAPPAVPTPAPGAGAGGELDAATLERARAGDPIALRAFVVRYERAVFALLSRMLGAGPHVEDLAQETFLRAVRALPMFRPDGPARASTWLLTIATRLALDARKKKRVPLAPPEAALAVADPATPETERARRELGARLARAAATLGDDQRAAFVLVELHGFTLAEVGRALDVPEATAKTRLFRAREKMRAALAQDGEPAAPAADRSMDEEG